MAPATRAARADRALVHSASPIRRASIGDLVLFGIVVLSNVDFDTLGLTSDTGLNVKKWLILAPVWLAPGVVIPLSRSLFRIVRRSPLCWLASWALWAVVSALWTLDLQQTLLVGLPMLAIICFVVWYTSQNGWVRFLRVFSAGTLVFLWASFVREIVVGAQPGTGGRLTGLSFGPTDIGIVAALALVAASALWANGTATVLARSCVASAVITLLWANARGSMIAATLGLGVVLISRIGSWRAFLVGVAALVAAGVFLASGQSASQLTRSGDPKELTTLTGRTDVWPIAWHIIADRPLLGHGTGTSQALFDDATRRGLIWWHAFNAHNVFLTVAIEQGLVGVVLMALALLAAAWRLRGSPWALALVVVFISNGTTEAMLERPNVAIVAIAAAATVAARADRTDRRVPGTRPAADDSGRTLRIRRPALPRPLPAAIARSGPAELR